MSDVFESQAILNQKKKMLNLRDDQTADEWLSLAREYQAIDSRGNFAYCTKKAIDLGAKIERAEAEIEEPDVPDWTDI